jgi:hypothetical protein
MSNELLMLLIPMDGPYSPECIVRCKSCDKHVSSRDASADIKGEPYRSFYCPECVQVLRPSKFVKVMTREEFFAKVENATL